MNRFVIIAFTAVVTVGAIRAQQPNFIFMLSDDQSWNGLSVAMHPEMANSKCPIVKTPNLERLAAQGMRFSAAYAPASVCSPTRLSLMNGKSPAANHWTKASKSLTAEANPKLLPPRNIKAIAESDFTIAEALRSAGYRTAHFGKWHLIGGGPGEHGFDVHDGDTGNEHAFKFKDPNPVDIFGMCERAESFMAESKRADKPFYVQLSWHALHAPENALQASTAKYAKSGQNEKQVGRLALTEDLDTGVGRILDSVERLGLNETTYIVYTSDNGGGGGGGKDRVLSGGKGSVWEGGIRVPLIVRGPGVAANSWCHESVVGYDFYPTFCELAGVTAMPEAVSLQLDGGSLVSILTGKGAGAIERRQGQLVFHFPHYQGSDGPHSAIIAERMKLIHFYESGTWKLFDLGKDVGERVDLASSLPEKAAELNRRLAERLHKIKAQMPSPNPDYDPSKPTVTGKGKRGGDKKPKKDKAAKKKRG